MFRVADRVAGLDLSGSPAPGYRLFHENPEPVYRRGGMTRAHFPHASQVIRWERRAAAASSHLTRDSLEPEAR